MVHGGTDDTVTNRQRLQASLRKRGWAWGQPHRGEDETRHGHWRYEQDGTTEWAGKTWPNYTRVNRKAKEQK